VIHPPAVVYRIESLGELLDFLLRPNGWTRKLAASISFVVIRTFAVASEQTAWVQEQGGDPSMVDSGIYKYEKLTKMVVVDASERTGRYWRSAIDARIKTEPSAVSNAIKGNPVRLQTHSILRQAVRKVVHVLHES